ncbi:MAG: hypothetical protein HC858_10745, partial [Brachymonas sp.]|nr:hypothetical protein [Brachymonas sp.]
MAEPADEPVVAPAADPLADPDVEPLGKPLAELEVALEGRPLAVPGVALVAALGVDPEAGAAGEDAAVLAPTVALGLDALAAGILVAVELLADAGRGGVAALGAFGAGDG